MAYSKLNAALMLGTAMAFFATLEGPARAEAADASAKASETDFEPVIVTARRRDEQGQSVPVTVSVLSGKTLERRLINNVSDLTNNTPNVVFAPSGFGSADPSMTIRGQHQQENIIGEDPSVGIYFADFLTIRAAGTNSALYDLASVQILKGPQGTLFGKNTTGGAVLITPQAPTFDGFSGSVGAGFGDYDRHHGSLVLNMPISDQLAVRIAGDILDHSGYIKNLSGGPDKGDEHSSSVRVSVRYRPTDNLDSTTVYQYVKFRNAGDGFHLDALNTGVALFTRFPALVPQAQAQFATLQRSDFWSVFSDNNIQQKVDGNILTNTTKWDVGGITLKNIVGYRWFRFQGPQEYDGLAVAGPPQPFGQTMLYGGYDKLNGNELSEEFQVLGKAFDDRMNWIAGAYVFREQGLDSFNTINYIASNAVTTIKETNKTQSVFAQADYKILEKLTLTAGYRYTWDQRDENVFASIQLPSQAAATCRIVNAANVPVSPCNNPVGYKGSAPTYNLTLDYKLNDHNMIYLSHRRGYRSGGTNNRAYTPSDPKTFRPEVVKDIEVGIKTENRLGDMPVRLNAAYYYQDYKDIQRLLTIASPATGVVATAVFNAAKAKIQGVEIDGEILPTRGLSISGYYGLTDTEYDSFNDPNTKKPLLDNTGQPLNGHQFAYVPKYSGGVTIRYEFPMEERIGQLALQGSYNYVSSFPMSENTIPGTVPPSKTYNFLAELNNVGGKPLDIRAFVKNATNAKNEVAGVSLYTVGFVTGSLAAPRTVGVELAYHF
jgi:iron complex outermembrane receptor protein